jgi:hypothetical protein
MQTLFETYGQASIPTGMKAIPPPKIPILSSTKDYAMFMQLCTAGNALGVFVTSNPPIWTQLPIPGTTPSTSPAPPRDLCNNTDATSQKIVGQATALYNQIREALVYFHNQLNTGTIVYSGDSADTSLYAPNPV